MKQVICMTLDNSILEFISRVAEMNNISRSKAVELIASVVSDYFSDSQLLQEHQVRGVIDGRRKKVQG